MVMSNFSDYIVFVDESGDHGIEKIDSEYPIFVLTCCVFEKQHYCDVVLPALSKFKMKYWGNDTVILHEADIRRQKNEQYNILKNPDIRESFMQDLSSLMEKLEFFHITTIIDKNKITGKYKEKNTYDISLLFCLERIHKNLTLSKDEQVDIIIEKRGKREDYELILEFKRIISGKPSTFNTVKKMDDVNFNLVMQDKKANIAGLQIADLIARPIGLNFLRPNQTNQAYEIIKGKKIHGIKSTLKIFP